MKKVIVIAAALLAAQNSQAAYHRIVNGTGEDIEVKFVNVGLDKKILMRIPRDTSQYVDSKNFGEIKQRIEVRGLSRNVNNMESKINIGGVRNTTVLVFHVDAKYAEPGPGTEFVIRGDNLNRNVVVPKIPNTGHFVIEIRDDHGRRRN